MNESIDRYTSIGVKRPSLQNRIPMGSTLIFKLVKLHDWRREWNLEDKEAKQERMGARTIMYKRSLRGPVLADEL